MEWRGEGRVEGRGRVEPDRGSGGEGGPLTRGGAGEGGPWTRGGAGEGGP